MKKENYSFEKVINKRNERLVLVIYDILDNKRRTRIVKTLESYGDRVQKSAFELYVTEKQYKAVTKEIGRIISPEDNVRVYRLNSSNEIMLIGISNATDKKEIVIV